VEHFFSLRCHLNENKNYGKNKSIGSLAFIYIWSFFSFFFVDSFNSYVMKCQHEKNAKKQKNVGLNGTEPGVQWNIVFLCNGLITFIK